MTAVSSTGGSERRYTAAVLAMGLILLLPTLSYRMGVDQGVFAYLGEGILHGRWPYSDAWESDYPGMMFLQALEILVFGKSIVMFRVFDLAVQMVALFLVLRLAVWGGSRAGGVLAVGLYALTYQSYGPWNTAQREGFAMPLILWGYWLYATRERRSAGRTAFGIGLGLGLAAVFKPTMLALALFYLPLLPALRRSRLRVVGLAGLGLVLPALSFIAFYAGIGGLTEMYEATVSYQAIYTARLQGDVPLVAHWIANVRGVGWQTLALAVAFLPVLLLVKERRGRRLMLYFGYLGAMLGVIVQGTFAGYHYLPGLAIGAAMISAGFAVSFGWLDRHLPRIARHDLAAALILVLIAAPAYLRAEPIRRLARLQFLRPPAPLEFHNGTVFDFTESHDVARYLREHSSAEDRILIWGYEPLTYYLADRVAASRFHITHPLVMRKPDGTLTAMQERWRAEFLDSIAAVKPLFVAVVRQDNWWWAPGERTSEEMLDDFPAWKRYLESHYRPVQTIGRFVVYRRADPVEVR